MRREHKVIIDNLVLWHKKRTDDGLHNTVRVPEIGAPYTALIRRHESNNYGNMFMYHMYVETQQPAAPSYYYWDIPYWSFMRLKRD